MFEFKAYVVVNTRSLLFQMTGLKYKRNEEIGHYGQTVISFAPSVTAPIIIA